MRQWMTTLKAMAAMLTGFYLSASYFAQPLPGSQAETNEVLIGAMRPDFRLGSNTGEIVTPEDFAGKTLLINFWATWCAPCRQEMPMLMELQREYGEQGFQVLGIALDDVQSVRDFVQQYGINYPILVGAADVMATNEAYGNATGVLPYSVLVDRDGVVRWQYTGEVRRDDISGLLDLHL